jgi:hypothetical protein
LNRGAAAANVPGVREESEVAGEPLVLDSITEQRSAQAMRIVVCGSHGGIFPGRLAAHRRVAAAIFNDAGIGRGAAGVRGLAVLDEAGVPGAAVDHRSARIGDGADQLARGRLSIVNRHGLLAGWEAGMPVAEAVYVAVGWPIEPRPAPPPLAAARQLVASEPVTVWALDSASLATPQDAGSVLATGSHGGLLGGRPETALKGGALAAIFNDAGIGMDGAGLGRLDPLAARGIPAATVSAESARIGEGRSTYESGIVSAVNAVARERGAHAGMTARDFVRVAAGEGARR